MAVLIPVHTVKGWFTACVPQLNMPLGFTRQTLGATYIRLLLTGDHSPLPITLLSAVSELFRGISSVSLHISTATKRVKCFIEHMLCIVLGVCMHNLRTGPNNKTFYKLTYVHTLAQISTPHCTIISLTSRSAIMFDKLPGDCVHLAVLRSTSLRPG